MILTDADVQARIDHFIATGLSRSIPVIGSSENAVHVSHKVIRRLEARGGCYYLPLSA